jgi:hypothetical protein
LPSETICTDYYRWLSQLPSLTRNIRKYAATELLTTAVLATNQSAVSICDQLCRTVVYRIEKVKADTKGKMNAKKKALVDLLAELTAQGWS